MNGSFSARQRIDKWLWHARVVRTRSAAAALAAGGHVRVNGARIDGASQPVRVGDVITIALDRSIRILKIKSFSDRRGQSAAARALYDDLSAIAEPQGALDAAGASADRAPSSAGCEGLLPSGGASRDE